jgi:chemotaxis response regulator CheB
MNNAEVLEKLRELHQATGEAITALEKKCAVESVAKAASGSGLWDDEGDEEPMPPVSDETGL